MKCGKYTLRKGTKVKIISVDKSKVLGIGTYVGYRLLGTGRVRMNVPKFRLGRKIIWGYDCWWIPLSVARRLEKKTLNRR